MFDVKLRDASFTYNNHVLFQHLNLDIPAARCVCLLGASGVGKSSLLHAMAGTEIAGEGVFSGAISDGRGQSLHQQVMLMTQEDSLLPWLSARDNILLGYRLRHASTKEIEARALVLLESMGITSEHFDKRPAMLSGGMRQRVALARLVMEDKPIWLLDEPFSALDAITRYTLQTLLCRLWKGKTVLLVTHDPLEALRLADDIYVLQGSPAQLHKIDISGVPPRVPTPELFLWQQKILEQLSGETSI